MVTFLAVFWQRFFSCVFRDVFHARFRRLFRDPFRGLRFFSRRCDFFHARCFAIFFTHVLVTALGQGRGCGIQDPGPFRLGHHAALLCAVPPDAWSAGAAVVVSGGPYGQPGAGLNHGVRVGAFTGLLQGLGFPKLGDAISRSGSRVQQ